MKIKIIAIIVGLYTSFSIASSSWEKLQCFAWRNIAWIFDNKRTIQNFYSNLPIREQFHRPFILRMKNTIRYWLTPASTYDEIIDYMRPTIENYAGDYDTIRGTLHGYIAIPRTPLLHCYTHFKTSVRAALRKKHIQYRLFGKASNTIPCGPVPDDDNLGEHASPYEKEQIDYIDCYYLDEIMRKIKWEKKQRDSLKAEMDELNQQAQAHNTEKIIGYISAKDIEHVAPEDKYPKMAGWYYKQRNFQTYFARKTRCGTADSTIHDNGKPENKDDQEATGSPLPVFLVEEAVIEEVIIVKQLLLEPIESLLKRLKIANYENLLSNQDSFELSYQLLCAFDSFVKTTSRYRIQSADTLSMFTQDPQQIDANIRFTVQKLYNAQEDFILKAKALSDAAGTSYKLRDGLNNIPQVNQDILKKCWPTA